MQLTSSCCVRFEMGPSKKIVCLPWAGVTSRIQNTVHPPPQPPSFPSTAPLAALEVVIPADKKTPVQEQCCRLIVHLRLVNEKDTFVWNWKNDENDIFTWTAWTIMNMKKTNERPAGWHTVAVDTRQSKSRRIPNLQLLERNPPRKRRRLSL